MTPDHQSRTKALLRRLSAPALGRLGIDPRQYWLLVDLFSTLGSRQEIAQLGGQEQSLRRATLFLFVIFSLFSGFMVYLGLPAILYLVIFLMITALQLSMLLLPEVAATLVNPFEVTVLAHQPITGKTWSIAKVTHLVRVTVYIVCGLNLVPAVLGVFLLDVGDSLTISYPIMHLSVALGLGMIVGLACCSMFGWLIRYVPPKRLQAIAALIQLLPMLLMFGAMTWGRLAEETIDWTQIVGSNDSLWSVIRTIPATPVTLVITILALLSIWAFVFGLRALSSNQLIRSFDQEPKTVRSAGSFGLSPMSLVSSRLGNQIQRSGFEYMSKIAVRDWQFWRNILSMIAPVLCGLGYMLVRDSDSSPFSSGFTSVHFMPHLLGFTVLMSCRFSAYGSDYKSAWLFVTIPGRFVHFFAQGVTLSLFLSIVILPHMIGVVVSVWSWPLTDLALFGVFSVAVTTLYLCVGVGSIGSIPFGKQFEPDKKILTPFFMYMWALCMAGAVGIQFLLFLSHYAVGIATLTLSVVAVLLAKNSITRLAVDIKVHLDELALHQSTQPIT